MSSAREIIARALCARDGWAAPDDSAELEWDDSGRATKHGPAWRNFTKSADAILAALKAAGLAVVPVEATGAKLVSVQKDGQLFVGAAIANRGFCTFRKQDFPDLDLLHDAIAMLSAAQEQEHG